MNRTVNLLRVSHSPLYQDFELFYNESERFSSYPAASHCPGVILATWTHVFIAHNIRNSESLTPCLCECECVCMNRQECVSVYLRAGCLSQSCNVMLCCAAVTGTVLITVFFTVLITVNSLEVPMFMPLLLLHGIIAPCYINISYAFLMHFLFLM